MRRSSLSIIWALLLALGYIAAVIVVRFLTAAVSSASEQVGETGAVVGEALAFELTQPSVTDSLWALLVVDVAVIVIFWGERRRGAAGMSGGALGIGSVAWTLLAVGGLALVAVAAARLLDLDPQWVEIAAQLGSDEGAPGGLPLAGWILLALVHPLAVELLFRGTITRLVDDAGVPGWAVVLLPAVFAAAVAPSLLLGALAVGVGLLAGLLRRRTGALGSAVLTHYLLVVALAVILLDPTLIETDAALTTAIVGGVVASVVATAFVVRATSNSERTR